MMYLERFIPALKRLLALFCVSATVFMPLSNYSFACCDCFSSEIQLSDESEHTGSSCAASAASACSCAKEDDCSCDFTPDTHPHPLAATTVTQIQIQNMALQVVTLPIDYSDQYFTFRINSLWHNEHQTVAPHVRVTVLRV